MTDPRAVEERRLGTNGNGSRARRAARAQDVRAQTAQSTPFPEAVLWDMDGTLVDTEPYWVAAEFRLVERHGGRWSHADSLNLVGNDLLASGAYIRAKAGIDLTPEQIVDALLDDVVRQVEDAVPWRPGARELLDALGEAGVPCALVTMSYQRFVDPILSELAPGTFAAVVTGDAVARGKPHPEPYLTAAARLGVAAHGCLAVEDSEPGATSAVAAGCTVLVVPNHVPVPTGERRVHRDTLVGLSPAALSAMRSTA